MELKKKELIRLKSQSSYDTTYSVATTTTDGDNLSSDGFGSRASNSSTDCSTTPRKWRRVSIKRPPTHNDTVSSSSFAEYDDDDEDYESDESFPDDLDSDYGKSIQIDIKLN